MRILTEGRRAIRHAQYLELVGCLEEAEIKGRSALGLLRSAMDWLEDTPEFERAHQELDGAGAWVCSTFTCQLSFDDGGYFQDCPVALAHSRVGFSIGAIVKQVECSICGLDPEDCSHITGRSYDGEVCRRVVTELELLEVSLVGRPEQPDARIHRMSVSADDLRASLGGDFRFGMPVACIRCERPCAGVSDPFVG